MRHFFETHFGLVLLLSCLAGLIFPLLGDMPDSSAMVALALLTYVSCFKLADGGFSEIKWRDILLFYGLRYIVLPIIMLVVSQKFFPLYADGIFLLALLPTAVSSPAFAHMFGGRVPPAFAIVILSTILAPFLISLLCPLALAGSGVTASPLPLFRTLAFCVFLPMAVYFATRKLRRFSAVMYHNIKLASIILVAFVIALVVAKQRDFILHDTAALATPLLLTIFCYAIFLAFGWRFAKNQGTDMRISIATCSGFNNVALGVSVALLHFPQNVVLLMAVSEIAWALLPTAFRQFIRINQ
jgi:predicted Na+-dependent transporter